MFRLARILFFFLQKGVNMGKKTIVVLVPEGEPNSEEVVLNPITVHQENSLLWRANGHVESVAYKQNKAMRKKERTIHALQKKVILLNTIAERHAKEITRLQKESQEKDISIACLEEKIRGLSKS